jgi:hypothetical protein
MMEALRSSETSILTRATLRNISKVGILQIFFFVMRCLVTVSNNEYSSAPFLATLPLSHRLATKSLLQRIYEEDFTNDEVI